MSAYLAGLLTGLGIAAVFLLAWLIGGWLAKNRVNRMSIYMTREPKVKG